jgi:hypothetical protein
LELLPDLVAHVPVVGMQFFKVRGEGVDLLKGELGLVERPWWRDGGRRLLHPTCVVRMIAAWYQTHSTVLIQDQLATLPARVGGKLRARLAARRRNGDALPRAQRRTRSPQST